jgi:hypothetical protein
MTTRTVAVYSLKPGFYCTWDIEINRKLTNGDGAREIIWRDAMQTKRPQSRERFYEKAMALPRFRRETRNEAAQFFAIRRKWRFWPSLNVTSRSQ